MRRRQEQAAAAAATSGRELPEAMWQRHFAQEQQDADRAAQSSSAAAADAGRDLPEGISIARAFSFTITSEGTKPLHSTTVDLKTSDGYTANLTMVHRGDDGPTVVEVTEWEPPRDFTTKFKGEDLISLGNWTFDDPVPKPGEEYHYYCQQCGISYSRSSNAYAKIIS